jgi:citronellol/citronellal dehydrogenase
MSMCTLGMAEEFRDDGIAFNSLWPRTLIATAAVQNIAGGEAGMRGARKPEIMADAARAIFDRPARECTGNFFIDDEVLASEGVSDFEEYRFGPPGAELIPDLYVETAGS